MIHYLAVGVCAALAFAFGWLMVDRNTTPSGSMAAFVALALSLAALFWLVAP